MKKGLFYLLVMILLGVFLFSGWKLLQYYQEIQSGEAVVEQLYESAVATVPKREEQLRETISDSTEKAETEPLPPEETAPVMVDFEVLWAENEDVAGWLYCEDTKINYPVVQTENNSDYLYKLLDGRRNSGGTLFMDYRNDPACTDWNTVIYGHSMKSGTMFGSLKEYRKQEYYDAHPVWYYLTPEQNYKVELIAGYVTNTASVGYSFPMSKDQRDQFLEECFRKSAFATEVKVAEEDVLMTFSTCSYEYDDARYILVGVLRKIG